MNEGTYTLTMIIILFNTTIIFSVLFFIARKNVGMKIKSMIAKKRGQVLVKYLDPQKGYYEEFAHIKENTVKITPPGSEGKLLGINPKHIYFDSIYYIRAINVNEAGSYMVDGVDTVEQSFMSAELADKFVKKSLMNPKGENNLMKWIKYLLFAVLAMGAIVMLAVYLSYQNYQILSNAPQVAQTVGGVL